MSSQVNRPTNVKDKEADVNRKLQFYGIFSGMSTIDDQLPEMFTDNSSQLSKLARFHP
jgi:hypothetical protein